MIFGVCASLDEAGELGAVDEPDDAVVLQEQVFGRVSDCWRTARVSADCE